MANTLVYDTLRRYIHTELEQFLQTLAHQLHLDRGNLASLFLDGISYCIMKDVSYNPKKCAAVIFLDQKERQCSRKRKYGSYCGLHHNKIQKLTKIRNLIDHSGLRETVYFTQTKTADTFLQDLLNV